VSRIVDFTPQRKDTPVENKRDPKVERTPPPVTPTIIPDGWGDPAIATPAVYVAPEVDVVGPGLGGLDVGSDRDVLPLVRVAPDYPPREQAKGTEGWVQVQFAITPTGAVRDAVVVASEPGSVFDGAALKAIARWRYNPRIDRGVAVERVGMQTVIRFQLRE
jgi:protein TonB